MKRLRKKNQLTLTLMAVLVVIAGYLSYIPKTGDTVPAVGEQNQAGLMDLSEEDILAENMAIEQARYMGITGNDSSPVVEEGEMTGSGQSQVAGTSGIAAGNGTGLPEIAKNGAVSVETLADGSEQTETIADIQQQAAGRIEENQGTDGDGETMNQPGEAVLTWAEQVKNVMAEAELSRSQVRTRNEETLNALINNANLSEKQREAAADNLMTMTENARIESNIESMLEAKGIPQNMVTISENGVEVLIGSSSITDSQRAQIEDTVKREADVEITDVIISLMNPVNTTVVEEP